MDKSTISLKRVQDLKNQDELLALLNEINQEEIRRRGHLKNYCPFTEQHIAYYSNPNNVFHRYKTFNIKKKRGGERCISAPRTKTFLSLLHCLNELLKSIYSPTEYVMGFTEGKSVAHNAEKHRGMNYILNLDLKNFFPSITQARIWSRLKAKPYQLHSDVAKVIAGLCCYKDLEKCEEGLLPSKCFVLPQGAPTSPIITNMICERLDRRLAGLAKKEGLNYTRYADDITFSSRHNVYKKDGDFFKELYRIIEEQGFKVNADKTRLQKKGKRQEVTGIIVSEKINVTCEYVRNIRNILYIWDRYGYNEAYSKFYPKYKANEGKNKKGNPDLVNVIHGKLMYLKMVKGEEDSLFRKLYSKYSSLVEKDRNTQNKIYKKSQYTLLATTPVIEFEKKNQTKVIFVTKETDAGKAKRYSYFTLGGYKISAYVSRDITLEDEKSKKDLVISSCKDKSNKPIWLVHKLKCVTISKEDLTINELNKELDNLLIS